MVRADESTLNDKGKLLFGIWADELPYSTMKFLNLARNFVFHIERTRAKLLLHHDENYHVDYNMFWINPFY